MNSLRQPYIYLDLLTNPVNFQLPLFLILSSNMKKEVIQENFNPEKSEILLLRKIKLTKFINPIGKKVM